MAKRFKPTAKQICKIGTIAHNRSFTERELREYTGAGPKMSAWLKRNKLVGWTTAGMRPNKWYPTPKGWKMIEKACASPKALAGSGAERRPKKRRK